MENCKFKKGLVIGIVMLFVVTGIIPNIVRDVGASDDGLVGYWSFDEGSGSIAHDSSGYGNHGTVYGATWSNGVSGNALHFDGDNDYVRISDSSSLDVLDGLSLEAWIKVEEFFGDGNYNGNPIVAKWGTSYIGQYHISAYSSGCLKLIIADGSEEDYLIAENALIKNQWYHIVLTWDGNYIKIYVNSKLIAEKTTTITELYQQDYSEDYVQIGHDTGGNYPWWYFDGIIDEVRIYNRALTASEIQNHYEEHMPSDGLVGYWSFDEESGNIAYDSSGYGNHGTIYGASWTTGVSGNALNFDGTNDYVSVPDSSNLDFGINDFTVEFWVNFKDLQYNDNGLIHKDNFAGSLSNTRGWLFNTCEDCGTAYSYGTGSSGVGLETRSKSNGIGSDTHSRYATSNFHLNTWYHIVGVRDSNVLYLYVDGVLRATTPEDTPADLSNDIELRIGSLSPTSPQFFNGIIDEVRIYNRALSASEILEHYNNPGGGGLIGYWSFDEGSGSIAYDSSGYGNHGTIYGAAWTSGISGHALKLDGVDDYVMVPDTPSLNPTDEITLEAWYKPTQSFKGDGNNPIIDKGYGQHIKPYYQYHLGVAGDLYEPSAMFHFNIAAGEGLSSYPNTEEGFWSVGNWYHIVGTYDGSTMRLYVDGELIESTKPISDLVNYGQDVYFGIFSDLYSMTKGVQHHLPGIIDEVRIYNRALTASEIEEHYEEFGSDIEATGKIKLYIHNLDEDELDISVYIDGEFKGKINDVVPSRDAIFLTMAELEVEESSHFILISYDDTDLAGNTDSQEIDVIVDETTRVDLFTMRANKSGTYYDHYAQKEEDEDFIIHSFQFSRENVEKLAEDEDFAGTVAGQIMDDIKDVHGTFYFSDLGVAMGEFLSEWDIKNDLHTSAPDLKNPDGSYQYGTYQKKISTSQILKTAISVLDLSALIWRSITTPKLTKFLSAIGSVSATVDFVRDRADEWIYNDDIEIDIARLASDTQPLIELATNYQASTEASLIFNVATDMIEYVSRDEVVIKIDGNRLSKADDYDDILDPTNENEAEYYVNHIDDEYTQIIVSNPNFYDNDIVITRTDYVNDADGADDSKDDGLYPDTGTPGFEFIFVIVAIAFVLFFIKQRRIN